jgi:hypothetical protein
VLVPSMWIFKNLLATDFSSLRYLGHPYLSGDPV